MSRQLPSRFLPAKERRAFGRSRRAAAPRAGQGRWQAPRRRADIVAQIRRTEEGRLWELLPIKHGCMEESPFVFFRGLAEVMANDIARLPVSGLDVQLCGDAHVRDLGAVAGPSGGTVFDINDFDQTIHGPWEWGEVSPRRRRGSRSNRSENDTRGCVRIDPELLSRSAAGQPLTRATMLFRARDGT